MLRGINARLIAMGIVLLSGVQCAAASDSYVLLRLAGSWVKWGNPTIGTRARVTYALATASMESPKALNCRSIVPVGPLLRRSEIALGVFQRELRAAFAAWSRAADITFVPVDDSAKADIVIGAQRVPRGRAFADVSFNEVVSNGIKSIRKSVVCLNPAIRWKVGFDGNVDVYDLRYTLIHEIGHAIGLDHPGPSGQIMSFNYHEEFRGLQAGDANGVSRLYGKLSTLAAKSMDPALAGPDSRYPDSHVAPPQLALGASDASEPRR